jgi:hypothetical protein
LTVIAQDVFTTAMTLMDEASEDGTFAGFSDEYKNKSWILLTMLQSELLEPNVIPQAVTGSANAMQLDDKTCLTVLPYGLAAHLLLTEDPDRASFYNARYDELKLKIPSSIVAIQSVYNLDETEIVTPDPNTIVYDGGSFLNPGTIVYDGGDF